MVLMEIDISSKPQRGGINVGVFDFKIGGTKSQMTKPGMVFMPMTDFARYHAKKEEIKQWRVTVDEKIRIARNAISVWAQSHRNLGNGIPVPPLIDVAGFTGGVVGAAVNKVVP